MPDIAPLIVAARWLHFAAESLLFGMAVFALGVASEGKRLLSRTAMPLALLALGSGLAWAFLLLRDLVDDAGNPWLGAVQAFFLDTSFGRVWIGRLVLLDLLVAAAAVKIGRAHV